jgi:hypothetical protein
MVFIPLTGQILVEAGVWSVAVAVRGSDAHPETERKLRSFALG